MPDIERGLVATEEFLMRQLGSRAAREAGKRKLHRGLGEAMRRARRAALIFALLLLALVAWAVAVSPIGFFTWLVALPTIAIVSLVSMMWPTRAARAPKVVPGPEAVARIPLDTLANRCEHWLLDRCDELPRAALPSADTILARLQSLQPALADMPEGTPLSGEARRLIGGHLPRLVDSYLALPPEVRDPRSENSRRLTESLEVVAEELSRICTEVETCRTAAFEIEHRFIETRYKEDGSLRGD